MGRINGLGIGQQRDTQRSKVYAAETIIRTAGGMEWAEVQKYVRNVQKSKLWHELARGRNVYVKRGKGGSAHPLTGEIFLGVWSRQPAVILHEMAHLVDVPQGVAWHGHEFCAAMLKLVSRFMGVEAAKALKASYRKEGARYKPKTKRAPLSEERKQQLREQLAKARAVKAAA